MNEQAKDEGKAIACPRCGGEMVICDFITGSPGPDIRPRNKRNFLDTRYSDLEAIACSKCGYVEFRATQPEQLLPKEKRK